MAHWSVLCGQFSPWESDEARTLRADANFKRKVREREREREAIGREGRMGEGGAETEKERELCLCYYAIICVCMGCAPSMAGMSFKSQLLGSLDSYESSYRITHSCTHTSDV